MEHLRIVGCQIQTGPQQEKSQSQKEFCSNKDFITVNKAFWEDRVICNCLKTDIKKGMRLCYHPGFLASLINRN